MKAIKKLPERSIGLRQGSVRIRVVRAVAKRRVKICGLTHVEDAQHALDCGADLLGMIMWPKTKRYVTPHVASEITTLTKRYPKDGEGFPKTVGVFVEENADQIHQIKAETGIDIVQLHGATARAALPHLDPAIPKIYVLNVDNQGHASPPHALQRSSVAGRIQTEAEIAAPVDFVLIDGLKGGSGVRFPLEKLSVPDWVHDQTLVRNGWLLAGGLTPDNVFHRLQELHDRGRVPCGVDVSSGVCDESRLRKSHTKIEKFLTQVRLSKESLSKKYVNNKQ